MHQADHGTTADIICFLATIWKKIIYPCLKNTVSALLFGAPLASGILSGKYNQGIPSDSRLAKEGWLVPENFMQMVEKTKKLCVIAQELSCTMSQLAIAWCLHNPHVSSVITGATKIEQLMDNLGAIDVKAKLTKDVMKKIDTILR